MNAIEKVKEKQKATELQMFEKQKRKDNTNEFYVNIDNRIIKIEFSSAHFIEAKGDYVLIQTETTNYVVHSTLKKIEEILPNYLFFKAHPSFIINIKKIIHIEDKTLLIGEKVIPISEEKITELMKKD